MTTREEWVAFGDKAKRDIRFWKRIMFCIKAFFVTAIAIEIGLNAAMLYLAWTRQ